MLYPPRESQEGTGAFGCLSCTDGKAEAGGDQVFTDRDLHFEEAYVTPSSCSDCDLGLKNVEYVAV